MVDVQVDFDAGSRRDPRAQAGLAQAATQMMSRGLRAEGKAKAMDENTLSEAWADWGAQVNASASWDRASFSLRSLSAQDVLPQASALMGRWMAQPAWDEAIWRRERQRWSSSLAEALSKPSGLGQQAFTRAVYGDHPYGFTTSEATLTAIGTDDMRRWHSTLLLPCRAVVSVVGALDRSQATALVQRIMAPLQAQQAKGCSSLPPVPQVKPLAQPQNIVLPHSSAQTHLWLGQVGYARDDPDFFPLLVANHILGGSGFNARLTQVLREQRGYTYSVFSAFAPAAHAGAFSAQMQTRPDQAAHALALMREVIQTFVQQGPTVQELQQAQDNLVQGFGLRIDNNRKLLAHVASIGWYGLPLDYLQTWTRKIQAVTAQDMQRAMARVLQPDRMVSVVVGPAAP
jgi:zinc protease